jgi:hypothetical protein
MKLSKILVISSQGFILNQEAIQAEMDKDRRQELLMELKNMEPVPFIPVNLCRDGCRCPVCRKSGSPREFFGKKNKKNR